jgi:hypothetical protein
VLSRRIDFSGTAPLFRSTKPRREKALSLPDALSESSRISDLNINLRYELELTKNFSISESVAEG